ncbi:pre-mRNA splicing regulator USH1G-like [Artemia franciscana]|uniref:NAD(+) ADP-ribosyltransferase n=1 Tax=Artemia franciscana TaxID=6661 RepID=A0AA88L0E7_ARTSF|nr:hypothetical protein QYM36_008782 [Artemia franciscana]
MANRFHGAARDNDLSRLKEATKRDCNARDEDGMTPTLCAAFEGHLEALRILVGRGGDPDKTDHYGNTALHLSAARGHMPCVTFLVNFGVNIWAEDIDGHSPKELAAMNEKDEILNYLDNVIAKQDKKEAKQQKEKAVKHREKLKKDFEKVQKKAQEEAAKEQKRLEEIRKKMDTTTYSNPIPPSRPSVAALALRRDSRQIYGATPKFSELVNSDKQPGKKPISSVFKKAQAKKGTSRTNDASGSLRSVIGELSDADFKVGDYDSDGSRTVRSISGLRRDSEVMFKRNEEVEGKRGKLSDILYDGPSGNQINSNLLHSTDSGFGEEMYKSRQSIFERPGFGTMAFRNSITATLNAFTNGDQDSSSNSTSIAADSQTSLKQKDSTRNWENEDGESDEDSPSMSQLALFLAASGLIDLLPSFAKEQIDLDTAMLLTEADLTSMNIPLGPRKKLLKAIADRKADLEDPGEVDDSYL